MLHVKNLFVWYQEENSVIQGADLTIGSNRVVGLLGINGAGKTTLINTISGVHTKYQADGILGESGETRFAAEDFKKMRYTVFTEEQAFSYWNFWEYLAFIQKVYGKKLDREYLDYLIEGFRFQQYEKTLIGDLSTGNKKKVFLIGGFALKLPLLILDEPLDGLDFNGAEFLYEAMQGHKQYGSVLMSSHIAESFERTCDEILLLNHGKISRKEFVSGMDIRQELGAWLHVAD